MGVWSTVRQHLTFTPQETRAIALLVIALVAGEALHSIRTPDTPAGPATPGAALDSEFTALSRAVLVPPPEAASRQRPLPPPLAPGSVNINRASREELVGLPGIGPKTAEKIIAFRHDHGPFTSADDLLAVSGIGPKKLARIQPYLRWNEP
jgi:competence ComEA-like helix-hairpin-helix protein